MQQSFINRIFVHLTKYTLFCFIVVLTILFTNFNESVAQEEQSSTQFGFILSYKTGMNAIPPILGRKNTITFSSSPDFGIRLKTELSDLNNFLLDVELEEFAFQIQDASTKIQYPHNTSYLSFSPSIQLSGFIFGFSAGLPISAKINNTTFDKSKLNKLAVVNLGYNYEVYSDEDGAFNAYAKVSYFLSPYMTNYEANDPLRQIILEDPMFKITNENNPRVASIKIGISYLFNL